ncbi:MAG: ATP-binding cassette domain-containing protein [Candidatus Kapaibacteriota bacterium]
MNYIQINNISKKFSHKNYLFKDVSFVANSGSILGVCGTNGAGKSTLLKLVSGLNKINETDKNIDEIINYKLNNQNLKFENIQNYISYVAPYYNLYEEFSILELSDLIQKIRNNINNYEIDLVLDRNELLNLLLNDYKLYNKRNHKIKTFSSGMKQRTKIILALLNNSPFYFFDEYSMNLDEEGINITTKKIKELKNQDKVVIIATNDNFEKSICDNLLFLN